MREIIINKHEDNSKHIFLLENGVLLEQYEERENCKRLEGNIYLRKSAEYITRNASSVCGHRT